MSNRDLSPNTPQTDPYSAPLPKPAVPPNVPNPSRIYYPFTQSKKLRVILYLSFLISYSRSTSKCSCFYSLKYSDSYYFCPPWPPFISSKPPLLLAWTVTIGLPASLFLYSLSFLTEMSPFQWGHLWPCDLKLYPFPSAPCPVCFLALQCCSPSVYLCYLPIFPIIQ